MTESAADVIAVVWVTGPAKAWAPTLVSLRRGAPGITIVVSSQETEALSEVGADVDEIRQAWTPGEVVNSFQNQELRHVLLVHAPAVFPSGFLEAALPLADGDLQCSSVSFLSNVGAPAGFPAAGSATLHQVESLDEEVITRRLRMADGLDPATLPYPVGPAVLLSAQGLSVALFPEHAGRVVEQLAQHGARTRSHGMLDFLEPSTFVSHSADEPSLFPMYSGLNPDEARVLSVSHPGLVMAPTQCTEAESSFADALSAARVAVFGIRVLLDGSCLGPKEMGTQVAFLGLVGALAEQEAVSYLGIALATQPPRYAADVLSHPKVDTRLTPGGDLSAFPSVDVVHRPFQVTAETDWSSWRHVGRRIVLTVHDLIAFCIPDYHRTPELWFEHRQVTRRSAAEVDGLIAISETTRRRIRQERLPIDAERCFVIPDGLGHLLGDEDERVPDELLARGFSSEPFALVLGANYSYKNRTISLKVVRELRRRGKPLALVMAGALVPHGSSRADEAREYIAGEPVFIIPDVRSEERNWLLRHAELVLYLTGAEGFGLVPHEAAAFGTPTVLVPFGPFAERLKELPVAPRNWSVEELAKACEALLSDPAVARQQVHALADHEAWWSWDDVAERTVSIYRTLLARPARFTL